MKIVIMEDINFDTTRQVLENGAKLGTFREDTVNSEIERTFGENAFHTNTDYFFNGKEDHLNQFENRSIVLFGSSRYIKLFSRFICRKVKDKDENKKLHLVELTDSLKSTFSGGCSLCTSGQIRNIVDKVAYELFEGNLMDTLLRKSRGKMEKKLIGDKQDCFDEVHQDDDPEEISLRLYDLKGWIFISLFSLMLSPILFMFEWISVQLKNFNQFLTSSRVQSVDQ